MQARRESSDGVRGADDASGLLSPPDAADGKPHHSIKHRKKCSNRRMLGKEGNTEITLLNVPNRNKRFMQDLFTTLVECRWRYTLLVFVLSHFVSWFLFALVWYIMAIAHGDVLDDMTREQRVPCLINVQDFMSAFIFSMESQTTIGYGTAYPSRDCPQAVVVLCFQSVCGMIIEAFSVGIVFSKLTRPHLRTQTLLFSQKAVVAIRNKFLTLQFRVGDIRKSQLVNVKLWAVLRGFNDADEEDMDQVDLPVTFDGQAQNLSTIWPTIVMHRIDENSPLFTMHPQDFLRDHFEIHVYLEGTIQATGQTTQARTSYTPTEIMWGHKLYPVLRYNKKHCRYEADYNRFHETIEVETTPLCSAYDLTRVRRLSELNMLSPIREIQEETAVVVETG